MSSISARFHTWKKNNYSPSFSAFNKSFLILLVVSSLNQGLLLEQERLMSDYDKVKAEEQEKDTKLQKLM